MIAEKIKALREARGWSQAELSRRLGITRNGVNSWEQGLSMPSPACLVDLAKVFGVSTDYLLGLERLTTVDVTGLADRDVAVLQSWPKGSKTAKTDTAAHFSWAAFLFLTSYTFWCIIRVH